MPISSRTVGERSIVGRDAYRLYKQKSKRKKDKQLSHSDYKKVVKLIYKKVGEHMIENTSGVYMDMLGYFCIVMNPIRKMAPGLKRLYPSTIKRIYTPILFTDTTKGYSLSGWSMDRAFNTRNIKRKLKDKLVNESYHYKFNHTLIKSLGKNK